MNGIILHGLRREQIQEVCVAESLHVRTACEEDIPRLAELEKQKFVDAGMEVYDEKFFRNWLKVNPTGFLVSCKENGEVVGYTYQQCVDFDFDAIPRLTTYNEFTDHGHTVRTHRWEGNTIHGMSAVAVAPQGVYQIFKVIEQQMTEQKRKYIITGARIPGFDAFWKQAVKNGALASDVSKMAAAQSYVGQCVRLFGGFLWESFPKDVVDLPKPVRPDPVMNKWLKHEGFGVAAVLPNWMDDPRSHDFGVLMVLRNPHVH